MTREHDLSGRRNPQAHRADGTPPAADLARCDLPIEGMSCAGCATRIEKRLAKTPGVASANVNFATKVATVRYDPAATAPAALAKAVEDIGYRAIVPMPAGKPPHGHAGHDHAAMLRAEDRQHSAHPHRAVGEDHSSHMNVGEAEARRLLTKTIVGGVLALPVLVIAMSHGAIDALNVPWINWVQLALTTPVLVWCGSQFFRSAWKGGSASEREHGHPRRARNGSGVPLFTRGDHLAGLLRDGDEPPRRTPPEGRRVPTREWAA